MWNTVVCVFAYNIWKNCKKENQNRRKPHSNLKFTKYTSKIITMAGIVYKVFSFFVPLLFRTKKLSHSLICFRCILLHIYTVNWKSPAAWSQVGWRHSLWWAIRRAVVCYNFTSHQAIAVLLCWRYDIIWMGNRYFGSSWCWEKYEPGLSGLFQN